MIHQGIARPAVKAGQVFAIPARHVGDPANIGDHRRQGQVEGFDQHAVIDRRNRCALPARRQISLTELMHHRQGEPFGEPLRLPHLD